MLNFLCPVSQCLPSPLLPSGAAMFQTPPLLGHTAHNNALKAILTFLNIISGTAAGYTHRRSFYSFTADTPSKIGNLGTHDAMCMKKWQVEKLACECEGQSYESSLRLATESEPRPPPSHRTQGLLDRQLRPGPVQPTNKLCKMPR